MKKTIRFILILVALIATSCDNRLDIVPKGMTTFTNIEELETLLNQDWAVYDYSLDYNKICGQTYPSYKQIDELSTVIDLDHAWYFADETIDRVNLTDFDTRYNELYQRIYYTNAVISLADQVDGNESEKERIIAEAKILRAWFHFLVANFYAPQYDDATASTTGGIAYVDNILASEQKVKMTLDKVYERILSDCSDENIGKLKQTPANIPFRFETDFGYGVRARVLFQMKRYEDALAYAKKALAANSSIENRSSVLNDGTWKKTFDTDNEYLFITNSSLDYGCILNETVLSSEVMNLFEEGDYLRYYTPEYEWTLSDMLGYGVDGIASYMGSSARINIYGLNAEQMYYVSAESLILTGHIDDGLDMVDKVRANRIHRDYFKPLKGSVNTEKEAMTVLHNAKRVEFLVNFEHFFDCKRLNSTQDYAQTVDHNCGEYGIRSVSPQSPLWIFPFPLEATNYNPSLTQNY